MRLLVLGDGRCVWDDIERLGCKKPGRYDVIDFDGSIMCVNSIGLMVERFDYWYSNDVNWLKKLNDARRPEWKKMFPDPQLWSCMPGVNQSDPARPGSSGLNAAKTGIKLGYDEIILCGIPLDDSGHNGDPPWKTTNFTREVAVKLGEEENRAWKSARLEVFDGKVKSMSGRSKEWLGGPV